MSLIKLFWTSIETYFDNCLNKDIFDEIEEHNNTAIFEISVFVFTQKNI